MTAQLKLRPFKSAKSEREGGLGREGEQVWQRDDNRSAERDAALRAHARQSRHVVSDYRGVGHLQHLRRGLSVLRGQEPERADAGASARRSVFTSICLFSSSLTIVLAEKAMHRGNIKRFGAVLVADHRAGRDLSGGHGAGMARPDLRQRLDHQHQSCSARRFIRWSDCMPFT